MTTVKLGTYLAVEILRREDNHDVAHAILQASVAAGVSYQHLELLEGFSLGARSYARFRTDMVVPARVMDRLFAAGRSVVELTVDGYIARLPGGRKGSISYTTMLSAPKSPRRYDGPATALWERQFTQSKG